jgi:hypothetical protein
LVELVALVALVAFSALVVVRAKDVDIAVSEYSAVEALMVNEAV